MTLERLNLFARQHWKLIGAVVIMVLAAVVIGLLAGLCPPVLAAIAGFSVYGLTPFAALGVWAASSVGGLIGASFASAGIAAAAVAVIAGFFNLMYTITRAMDTAIIPKKDDHDIYEDLDPDEVPLDDIANSQKSLAGMGGSKKAKNNGVEDPDDSKNDKNFDSPLPKPKSKSKPSQPDDLDASSSHSAHL